MQKEMFRKREVSVWMSLIPIAVLVSMLTLVIKVFGSDAIEGGSQISLLVASSVAALISVVVCRCKWATLEKAITEAYSYVEKTHFENAYYRHDIGKKALEV